MVISRSVLLRMRNISDNLQRKHNTHFMFNNIFSKSHTVYDMTWNSMVESGRPRMTSWIPKARDTNSEYVILIMYLLQQWLHEYASILCYTYITRLWILFFLQQFSSCTIQSS